MGTAGPSGATRRPVSTCQAQPWWRPQARFQAPGPVLEGLREEWKLLPDRSSAPSVGRPQLLKPENIWVRVACLRPLQRDGPEELLEEVGREELFGAGAWGVPGRELVLLGVDERLLSRARRLRRSR